MEYCCTCAITIHPPPIHPPEKALPEDRRLRCCARVIYGKCIHNNNRFADYCPYCQISTVPSALPQGLKEPPSYSSVATSSTTIVNRAEAPPPYTLVATAKQPSDLDEKRALAVGDGPVAEDTLHFLDHEHDSVTSLSLRYGVPAAALRQTNNISSDHLLLGRKTILIPGTYYKSGVSLSPHAIDGEDEELRKVKIRRFMTSCKVSDYDVAILYLEQAGYDLEAALVTYTEDEAWERNNPNQARRQGKQTQRSRVFPWRRS